LPMARRSRMRTRRWTRTSSTAGTGSGRCWRRWERVRRRRRSWWKRSTGPAWRRRCGVRRRARSWRTWSTSRRRGGWCGRRAGGGASRAEGCVRTEACGAGYSRPARCRARAGRIGAAARGGGAGAGPDGVDSRGMSAGAGPLGRPARLSPALVAGLRRIVGRDAVVTDPATLLVYESDGLTAYRVPPRAVVAPRGTEEVAAVVRLLAEAGIPFVPRGAGTGLSGGALALEGSVVVSLARMDRILSIDPANRRARVEPGVVNARLGRLAAEYGLTYAPDPSSQAACTIGGNVAENAGGPHCLKYGVTSNHVTGLTVVLPDGEVLELGGGGGETVGYDLVGLFVGSEGMFGIATEIEVRLIPLPESVETLLAIFDRVDDASRAVSAIIA